jgi:hypothetical protein
MARLLVADFVLPFGTLMVPTRLTVFSSVITGIQGDGSGWGHRVLLGRRHPRETRIR